ncbi:MAG: tRNA (adenosine(37)-N6)-threonylcarbamoyltransferase complex transferase subunit TsaD [Anderseniella sp.]
MLGIETSCDETAAAVVGRVGNGIGEIISNVVLSQTALHAPYGGVVPEIAARSHLSHLDRLIGQAMDEAKCEYEALSGIAVTAGPGLIGGVLTGLVSAKALSLACKKPLYAINHLEGHALTPGLTEGLRPPYLMLLVSGGHTQLVSINAVGDYVRLGTTIDDALGEAFDKTAKLLGLGYPGGPEVERAAKDGNAGRFRFPVPMKGRDDCNFSFSGLKTAVRQAAHKHDPLKIQDVRDICASFQVAAVDAVVDRVGHAMNLFKQIHQGLDQYVLVASGGVAANHGLRSGLVELCNDRGFRLSVPPVSLCTDNAAMIAWAGLENAAIRPADCLSVAARARWPLDADAKPEPYAGVKA